MLHAPPISIFFILITRIISGEEYIPWRSLLCSLLHSPVTSRMLGPNGLNSYLFFVKLA
jgi:hypothetical protein